MISNYLFQLASTLLMPYIEDSHSDVVNSYIADCGCYLNALAFVADMCILDTFQLLDSINYF